MLLGSFLPDQLGVGNGVALVRALELRCPVWHIETACTTALAALEMARALIAGGPYRKVAVVISCSYSKYDEEAAASD